ncbi:MAG: hypothetical protein AB9836_02455 [Aminipila sp.]
MEKKTFELTTEIMEKEKYISLFKICFKNSDYFSLTINYDDKDDIQICKLRECIKEMQQWQVTDFKTNHWHCFYVTLEKPLNIFVFKSNKNTQQIILKYFHDIFLDGLHSGDICFFYNNEIVLGTVSHERICNLYPTTQKMLEEFLEWGNWQEIEFLGEEFVKLQSE